MKNVSIIIACLFLLQCKEDMDCGPVVVQPPNSIDTLEMYTLSAVENGKKILWHAGSFFGSTLNHETWEFGTSRQLFYYNPDENLAASNIPFKTGVFTLKRHTAWPYPGAISVFALTDYDAISQSYELDTTKVNFVKIDFLDSTSFEIRGEFEANFVVKPPKGEAGAPDSVAFKNGRFRFRL